MFDISKFIFFIKHFCLSSCSLLNCSFNICLILFFISNFIHSENLFIKDESDKVYDVSQVYKIGDYLYQ